MTKTNEKTSTDVVLDALRARPEVTAAEVALATGLGRSTANKCLATLEQAGKARRIQGGRDGGRRVADRWMLAVAKVPAGEKDTSDQSAKTRLKRGDLGKLVLDYLAERPDEDLGPTVVGKALGRSQGAVANALVRLADAGDVRLTSDSPRRYRVTTS